MPMPVCRFVFGNTSIVILQTRFKVEVVILISSTQGRRLCRWICRWYNRQTLAQITAGEKIAKLLSLAYVTLRIRTVNYKHGNLKFEPDVKITGRWGVGGGGSCPKVETQRLDDLQYSSFAMRLAVRNSIQSPLAHKRFTFTPHPVAEKQLIICHHKNSSIITASPSWPSTPPHNKLFQRHDK